MQPEGHVGLTLAILSLFMLAFGWVGLESIVVCVIIVSFSSLPDIDLRWKLSEHRGFTHSLLFGVIVGVILAVLFGYAGLGWQVGFLAGFLGTALHILGDILTHQGLKPFRPFSDYEIALHIFESKSSGPNKAFAILGGLLFFVVLLKYAGLG